MGSGSTVQVTFSHYTKQPSVENGSEDCVFLAGPGGDQMRQERALVIARCRADILGWLLLSCLLGVQDKRKEVRGDTTDW